MLFLYKSCNISKMIWSHLPDQIQDGSITCDVPNGSYLNGHHVLVGGQLLALCTRYLCYRGTCFPYPPYAWLSGLRISVSIVCLILNIAYEYQWVHRDYMVYTCMVVA